MRNRYNDTHAARVKPESPSLNVKPSRSRMTVNDGRGFARQGVFLVFGEVDFLVEALAKRHVVIPQLGPWCAVFAPEKLSQLPRSQMVSQARNTNLITCLSFTPLMLSTTHGSVFGGTSFSTAISCRRRNIGTVASGLDLPCLIPSGRVGTRARGCCG